MLRLITGRAGAGKPALVMDEIRRAALSGEGGRVLLVPEQYSHEAERELARVAGPGLPLCAEVLSFTGLARKLEAELGSGGTRCLDLSLIHISPGAAEHGRGRAVRCGAEAREALFAEFRGCGAHGEAHVGAGVSVDVYKRQAWALRPSR